MTALITIRRSYFLQSQTAAPRFAGTSPRRGAHPQRAIAEGVVTIGAPVRGADCVSVICTSPVPGGRSKEKYIRLPPVSIKEKLVDHFSQHRAAPYDWNASLNQESHGEELYTVCLSG